MSYAAISGNIAIIKFLYENGCNWSMHCTRYASEEGKISILKYFYENGCPWSDKTLEKALVYGSKTCNFECFEYLYKNGCNNLSVYSLCSNQIIYRNCNIFKYLFIQYPEMISVEDKNTLIQGLNRYLVTGFEDSLDNKVWRDILFPLDLSRYPRLDIIVTTKKKEILEEKQGIKETLYNDNIISQNVIKYILYPYL